jgi:nitrate/TMAO reductase-like tetraheme cytochrome c subunit
MVEPLKQRVPGLIRNYLSLIGLVVIALCLANLLFLLLVDVLAGGSNPYFGVLTYMVLPLFLVIGLVLLIVGMLRERARRRKIAPDQVPTYTKIDLNVPRQRAIFTFVGSFLVVFVLLTAVGSYRAYEFTDSTQFCGQLCHNVMNPEFTAYQASPHARVRCVECHVGPGASWYVRSKMSGMRQVYAATFNTFPRPIPSPVENLRPAQQTCEQCHWPEKFYGAQLKTINHFGYDEKNTPRQIKLLIKTGGGSPTTGMTTGIHWHMNISNEVWYVPTDKQRQKIAYVKIKDHQGRVTEFFAKDSPVKPDDIKKATLRRMDCVDCHNRPTHIYQPPDKSVDDLLTAGRIDISLPYVKKYAVEVMTKPYKTTQEGLEGIATDLDSTYMTKYPDVYAKKLPAIKQAITEVQRVFSTNIFPEMKLDWRTHPNNIGHLYSEGCFRCHDGLHVSKEGKVIARDCESCHILLGQENGGSAMAKVPSATFQHPGGEMDFAAVNCNECHSGGVGP